MLHSDPFPEFPCDGELIPMEELSTQRLCPLVLPLRCGVHPYAGLFMDHSLRLSSEVTQ